MQQPWRKPGRHARSLSVFNHFTVSCDLVVLFLRFCSYSLSLPFKCPFCSTLKPTFCWHLKFLSTFNCTLHFPWFTQIKCCPKSGGEPKWMITSCPSILPSSSTFSLTGVVGGWSQLLLGKKQLITALQLACVSKQNQQRVCTSALWIQSDAINISPLRPLQHIIYGRVLFNPMYLSACAGPSVQCVLTNILELTARSNDIPDICDFFHLVSNSFVWKRSAFCLECRPQPFPGSFLSNRAECSEFLATILGK